jgi:uncharacterized membrane protein
MRYTGVAALVALCVASTCFADLRFQPLVLDQLGYAYSQPRGINDHGTVVGVVQNSFNFNETYYARAVIWGAATGAGTLLGAPANYAGSSAEDINNDGVIVGGVSSGLYSTRAMRYSNGSFYLPYPYIGPPPTTPPPGELYSINDAGQAVGEMNAQPILLQGQLVTDLNGSSTASDHPAAISANNAIVGNNFNSSTGNRFAIQFRPGQTATRLESTSYSSQATDVNSKGTVVGHVTIPGTPIAGAVPVIFEAGGYTVLPGGFAGVGQNSAIVRAINDKGWIGGAQGMSTSSTADLNAAVWIDGQYRLATSMLADAYTGLFKINDIYDINNRGQMIAAARQDIDGDPTTIGWKSVAVRLDPIRSPGDTNYDDIVDFTDLLTLAQHYGQSGNGNIFWETGDFNFDWAVNFDDLLTLAQYYNAPATFESDWLLARSMVPEPASLAILFCISRKRRV